MKQSHSTATRWFDSLLPAGATRGGLGAPRSHEFGRAHDHADDRRYQIGTRTVAEQFAHALATIGLKRIYGIVGDSLNGLAAATRRQGKIEWVHVRHEEVAAFAAGAEAHLTGGADLVTTNFWR